MHQFFRPHKSFFLLLSLFRRSDCQAGLSNLISDFLRNTIFLAVANGQAFRFNMKAIKLTSAI